MKLFKSGRRHSFRQQWCSEGESESRFVLYGRHLGGTSLVVQSDEQSYWRSAGVAIVEPIDWARVKASVVDRCAVHTEAAREKQRVVR